jgi:hypothetical protein
MRCVQARLSAVPCCVQRNFSSAAGQQPYSVNFLSLVVRPLQPYVLMSVVSVIQDNMKTLTVRLPDELATQIDRESRERRISKSDIVRERLSTTRTRVLKSAVFDAIADLIGSVDGLPADLSTREKQYLKATGYGKKRHR